MPKRNCAWDKPFLGDTWQVTRNKKWVVGGPRLLLVACGLSLSAGLFMPGCAGPEYAIRQTPVPDESSAAIDIERRISAYQAQELEQQGARLIGAAERLDEFLVQQIIDRLSRVTERPSLRYHALLLHDNDPNAVALADGRIYLTTGLLRYLANRGSRADELAFVVGHEIAHTVAQHLVKRYQMLQRQQLLMALIAAGASAVTRNATDGVQQAGRVALDIASLMSEVHNSGYSQEQELEADQLGIRYVIRAGFNPKAALDVLQDFERFEHPGALLRTHPYMALRREYLARYLAETGALTRQSSEVRPTGFSRGMRGMDPSAQTHNALDQRRRQLKDAQRWYPIGSISWNNLQRQIDALEHQP